MTHSAEDFTLPSMTLVKTDTKLVAHNCQFFFFFFFFRRR